MSAKKIGQSRPGCGIYRSHLEGHSLDWPSRLSARPTVAVHFDRFGGLSCRCAHLAGSHKLAAVERLVEQAGSPLGTPTDSKSDVGAVKPRTREQVIVN